MKLVHEHWVDDSPGEHMLCLAGPAGDDARATLEGNAELVWTCEAESAFEALTLYYEHQGWGEYTSEYEELDRRPYIDHLGNTTPPADKDTEGPE